MSTWKSNPQAIPAKKTVPGALHCRTSTRLCWAQSAFRKSGKKTCQDCKSKWIKVSHHGRITMEIGWDIGGRKHASVPTSIVFIPATKSIIHHRWISTMIYRGKGVINSWHQHTTQLLHHLPLWKWGSTSEFGDASSLDKPIKRISVRKVVETSRISFVPFQAPFPTRLLILWPPTIWCCRAKVCWREFSPDEFAGVRQRRARSLQEKVECSNTPGFHSTCTLCLRLPLWCL